MAVDINTVRGLLTLALLLLFIWLFIWAYSKNRKKDFDDAANLPFADDAQHSASASTRTGEHS
ncbi:MAG: CcoQ/FixQ family Cbb3-type cytochrome c oxidase assembly chaperone [Pseudomonadales bacterium]|nr:CcoQ/FixQ family Cbb3-type cytochrome c oxidase assembly chaperone [Pseudomonadales bacterium]